MFLAEVIISFLQSIKENTEKIKSQVQGRALDISKELFTSVVRKTPVGLSTTRGQLINNWHVGEGIGNYNKTYSLAFNTSGVASYNEISKLEGSQEFLGGDGEVSFTNIVPYAFRAEYAGWPQPKWSGRVKPYAMVRISLLEVGARRKNG